MKRIPGGSASIIFIWLVVVALVGMVVSAGYIRSSRDLERLMKDEADRMTEVIRVASSGGIHALDEVEDSTARRLLDNARFIALLLSKGTISPDYMEHFAVMNGLQEVVIINRDGSLLMTVHSGNTGEHKTTDHIADRSEVQSVLSGASDEEVIGFMDSGYYSGQQYGVVVKKPHGGAVVVNTDSRDMLSLRKRIGLGSLFRELGSLKGIAYVVLQDSLGIIAASPGVTEMTRIADDSFLIEAYGGKTVSRKYRNAYGKIFEVAGPFVVDNVNLGIVRIGLSTEAIEGIRRNAMRQLIILFIAAVISGAFVMYFAVLKQNYRLLDIEHSRILTEVRRMEEEQRRSERHASLGRLAAGVAHEIRNPLNAISIIAQRLKAEFTPVDNETEYRSFLTVIGKEITRISAIVNHFLAFAKPPELSMRAVPGEELVDEVVAVVSEKARSLNVSIETTVQPGAIITCDKDQMKQALLNILLNALEALGDGGRIFFSVQMRQGKIAIQVRDSGAGIPVEALPSVFEPYFSTKDNGTGLGLSEVYRIITAHGGNVTAENAGGGGAIFTIILPDARKRNS